MKTEENERVEGGKRFFSHLKESEFSNCLFSWCLRQHKGLNQNYSIVPERCQANAETQQKITHAALEKINYSSCGFPFRNSKSGHFGWQG